MKPPARPRAAALWALGFALLWMAVCLGKPLRNDQIIFESAALGILQHGYPLIEYGLGFVNLGLWHPPLFFYLQALCTALTGSMEVGARLPGVLGLLVSAAMAWWALKKWDLREEAWAFLLLFFGSAQVLVPGIIPDHDGSLVLPSTLGLALLLISCLRRRVPVPLFPAASLVFLSLWAKLTTPPLVLVAWLFVWCWIRGPRRAWAEAFLPLALGLTVFVASFLAYSACFRLNPIFTVEYMLWVKLGGAVPLSRRLGALAEGLWVLGPPLYVLLGLGLVAGPREPWRRQGVGLLLAMALVPLLAFSLISPYLNIHPFTWKYLLPSRVYLILAVALLWPREVFAAALGRRELRLAASGFSLLLLGLLVVRHYLGFRALAPLGALAVGLVLACRGVPRSRWAGRLAAVALAMLLAEGAFFGIFQLTQSWSSPVEFNTDEKGYSAVTQALKDPRFQGAVFLCRKDVGFYTPGRRAIPIDPNFQLDPKVPIEIPLSLRPRAQALARVWPFPVEDWTIHASYERAYVNDLPTLKRYLDQDVDWVIDSNYDSFLKDPAVRALVSADFVEVRPHLGDYVFYRRRGPKLKMSPNGA